MSRGQTRMIVVGLPDQPMPAASSSSARRYLCDDRRLLFVPLRQREDFNAGCRHPDGMFELRRQRAIPRHCGPAVRQDLHMRLAEIDHRLDREEHAGAQLHAFAGAADMNDVRLVMEHAPQPMTAEIAHHAHALWLDIALNRMTDVACGGAGLYGSDAAHHRLIGHLDQPLGLSRDRRDGIHPAGIAIPSSTIKVTSILTMSPSFRSRSPGMPWQTTWLIDVQVE